MATYTYDEYLKAAERVGALKTAKDVAQKEGQIKDALLMDAQLQAAEKNRA